MGSGKAELRPEHESGKESREKDGGDEPDRGLPCGPFGDAPRPQQFTQISDIRRRPAVLEPDRSKGAARALLRSTVEKDLEFADVYENVRR